MRKFDCKYIVLISSITNIHKFSLCLIWLVFPSFLFPTVLISWLTRARMETDVYTSGSIV